MAGIFAFRCASCGELHEGSPSFAFAHPWHYGTLAEEDRACAKLTPDLCWIPHAEGTDRFVRAVLEIPIHGVEEPFTWGVWASLSERNFSRYLETWDEPDETDAYFAWLCNRLPYYPDTLHLKAQLRPRSGGTRPFLELERDGHPLAEHQYTGITLAEAQQIAEQLRHHT